jgi:hypothetical protein
MKSIDRQIYHSSHRSKYEDKYRIYENNECEEFTECGLKISPRWEHGYYFIYQIEYFHKEFVDKFNQEL